MVNLSVDRVLTLVNDFRQNVVPQRDLQRNQKRKTKFRIFRQIKTNNNQNRDLQQTTHREIVNVSYRYPLQIITLGVRTGLRENQTEPFYHMIMHQAGDTHVPEDRA